MLIFVGGEKEQLLTIPKTHKINVKGRKGFVKVSNKSYQTTPN